MEGDNNNLNQEDQKEQEPVNQQNENIPQQNQNGEEEQQPQEQMGHEPNNVQDELQQGAVNQSGEQNEGQEQGGEGDNQQGNKELIFNNDKDFLEVEPLFVDEEGKAKYDTYEVEFIVNDSKGNSKSVIIDLEKIKYKKPYYGGYVNKTNGTYYYHAYAQTDQYQNEHIIKNERSAQTYEYRTLSTKMYREFGTQMSYVGLYVDDRQDKVKVAREYFDHEQWKDRKEKTVKYLQKMMRGFFARKQCKKLRKERDDENNLLDEKEDEKVEDRKNRGKERKKSDPELTREQMLEPKIKEKYLINIPGIKQNSPTQFMKESFQKEFEQGIDASVTLLNRKLPDSFPIGIEAHKMFVNFKYIPDGMKIPQIRYYLEDWKNKLEQLKIICYEMKLNGTSRLKIPISKNEELIERIKDVYDKAHPRA